MNVEKRTIKQGITLNYVFCDKFTTNTFTVHFLMPLTERNASCYSLLSRVLKKGCEKYPTQEALNQRLEELYSSTVSAGVNKMGEVESFFVSANMLEDRFSFDGMSIEREAVAMANEILFHPLLVDGCFDKDIVAREKKAQINRIRALINNKSQYAMARCRENMCEGEAYAIPVIGTEKTLSEIDSATLYNAYIELLSSARVEIVYIGSKPVDAAVAMANDFVSTLAPRPSPSLTCEIVRSAKEVRSVTETVAATQGNLVMGFRTDCVSGEEDEAAFKLFDSIYGSSAVSKLFVNVREKLSLCYHCSSRRDMHKGVMYVVAGIENANLEVAKREILAQLEEVCLGHITENEMIYAKEALLDGLRGMEDDQDAMESWCFHHMLRDSVESLSDLSEKIDRLTVEDVVRVARRVTLDLVYFLEGVSEEEGCDD